MILMRSWMLRKCQHCIGLPMLLSSPLVAKAGRPYMEAMACGLPTIGSGATGNLDFMTDENSVLIAGRYMPVSEEGVREITIYAGHHWFEPDVEDLRRAATGCGRSATQCSISATSNC